MAWEPISTLPQDDHHRIFTSSPANADKSVDELSTEGLVQAVGSLDADGKFVLQQELRGEPGEGWEPTHYLVES